MPPPSLDLLAQRLTACLKGHHDAFCVQMIRFLLEGRPVPPARLAAALSMTTRQVNKVLACLSDTERDKEGHVIGWGVSLHPTPHRFCVGGYTLSTWCAFDALTYPSLFGLEAQVSSTCPVTHSPISLSLTPSGMNDLVPADAVLSLIIPSPTDQCECGRAVFCDQGHLFVSPDAATRWQASHPDALVLPVEDAYQLGRLVVSYRYAETIRVQYAGQAGQ